MTDLIAHYVFVLSAVIVGVLGSARLTRLLTQDAFPPAAWVRERWVRLVRGNEEWSIFIECPWCVSFWIVAANTAWALLSDFHWSWWLANGVLAAAYAAAWVVFHDEG
jgi:sterol desaturase/sphingolipid hydroxylase (fatty acid hydroxylase superfamily)